MSHWHWLKFGVGRALHFNPSSCAHYLVVLIHSTTLPSTLRCPSSLSLSSSFSFSWSSSSSSMMWETSTLHTLADEDFGTLAENDPLTGYEPNYLHISETTELFIQESSDENRSLNSHDLEFDDYTIGMALSSPLFHEREDAASRRRAYHSPEKGLSSSQSSSVGRRTGRPVEGQFDSLIWNVRETQRHTSENEQIRILLERQREQTFFPSEAMLWIKEVEIVDYWKNWSPRDQFLGKTFQVSGWWTRRFLLLWTRSTKIPKSRRRSVSRNRKPRRRIDFFEEDRSPSWSTTTFEWLALMIQWWITLMYSLLPFMKIVFRKSIQDGMKFYHLCQRFHPMISWKVCSRESAQLKTVLELYDMEIHQKISMPKISKIEDNGEEQYRSETSITKFWRQTRENWNRSSGQESNGTNWRWRRKRYLLPVERKRPVFERRPMQFPAWE